MKNKTTEEWYQEFKRQGFDHQQAREMAIRVIEILQNSTLLT